MSEEPELQKAPKTPRRLRLRLAVLGGLAILIFATAVGGYLLHRAPAPEPPVVDLQGVEPRVAAAIEDARAAVQRAPASAESWGGLGMVLLAHQFWEEARLCFVEAERLNRAEPHWPYFQALVLTREDLAAAILKLQRTVELCKDEPESPRLKLADALLIQGQAAQAAEHFRYLIGHHRSHPAAHLGLARLAFEQGNLQESLDHVEYAKGSTYSRKAARTLLTTVLQRLGQPAAALEEARLVARLPDDAPWPDPFYEEVGQLAVDRGSRIVRVIQLLNQNRVAEALTALNEFVSAEPQWDTAWQLLGHVLLDQGAHEQAEKVLRMAVQLAPESADPHFYLGRALLEQGNQALALAQFSEAIRLKPKSAIMQYNIGHCLELRGQRRTAITSFQAALCCNPDLAAAHRDLGNLLVQEGHAQEGLVHLRRAMELDPQDEKSRRLHDGIEAARKASAGEK